MSLLLYLACAYAILALASRLSSSISARERLLLALLPLVATGEALCRGRVYAPVDSAWRFDPLRSLDPAVARGATSPPVFHDLWSQLIPWQVAVRAAWRAGEWPLWNPYSFCGEPLLGSYQPAPFHPLHLLSLLLPLPIALTFVAAGTLLLAAVSMYLLCRRAGASPAAGLFGAAAWTYSGYLFFWLGWPVALSAAVVPWLIAAALDLAAEPGRRSVAQFTVAASLLLLAGNPETVLLGAISAVAAFGVEARATQARIGDLLPAAVLAAVLPVAICSIQLLPFLDVLPESLRVASYRAGERNDLVGATFGRSATVLLESVAPFANGVDRPEPALPERDRFDEPRRVPTRRGIWAGGLTLAAALVGLRRARGAARLLLGALGAAGLLLAANPPGLSALLSVLPWIGLLSPRYGALWGTIALVVFAALGLGAVEGGGARGRRSLALLAVSVAGALAVSALVLWVRAESSGAELEAELFMALVAIGAVLLGATWLAWSGGNSALVLALIPLILLERQLESGTLRRSFPEARFPRLSGFAAKLDAQGEPFRVFGLGARLRPHLATFGLLEDARGNNPLTFARLARTFPFWTRSSPKQAVLADRLVPFLDLMNVRFALVGKSDPLPAGWHRTEELENAAIAENEHSMPRAFLPGRVRWQGSETERLDDLRGRTDFRELAWLEPYDAPAAEAEDRADPMGQVAISKSGFSYAMTTRLESPSWVVISVAAWPGWVATAEGRPLRSAIANEAFLAVLAPAGAHEVRLEYRPRAFLIGRAISFASIAGLVAFGLASCVHRFRSSRRAQSVSASATGSSGLFPAPRRGSSSTMERKARRDSS